MGKPAKNGSFPLEGGRVNAIKLRELCSISRDLSADGGRKR